MRRLLILAGVLVAALLAATQGPAWANPGLTVSVSPDVVDVGLNFAATTCASTGRSQDAMSWSRSTARQSP
jgi:hypothetical protein